ncbi:flocculation protein FLO11 [Ixodes scapularis]
MTDDNELLWLTLAERYVASRKLDWESTQRVCFNERCNPDDHNLGVQIVKDLHRTGCSLFSGELAEQNQALLKRVLLAYARWNKSVGYCQGFNLLAAFVLEVVDWCDRNALKMMIFLVEGVLPEGYFANHLRGLSVDMAVFRDLLRLRLSALARHLDDLQMGAGESSSGTSYEPPLTNVFTMQWFLTLFTTCLPKATVLRVWDLILLEGNEVLLRTALAIWDGLADRIMSVNSADEFYSIMGVLTREMVEFGLMDANELVKTICTMAPFPFPQLTELRDRYTYNIRPLPSSSLPRHGLRLFFGDDDDNDADSDHQVVVAAAWCISNAFLVNKNRGQGNTQATSPNPIDPSRMTLDISTLKRQYSKLRQRQKQAHIILTGSLQGPPALHPPRAPPVVPVNHLLAGQKPIVRKSRPPPPTLAVPTARAPRVKVTPSAGETLSWEQAKKLRSSDVDDSSSYDSSSTELCDDFHSVRSSSPEEVSKGGQTSPLPQEPSWEEQGGSSSSDEEENWSKRPKRHDDSSNVDAVSNRESSGTPNLAYGESPEKTPGMSPNNTPSRSPTKSSSRTHMKQLRKVSSLSTSEPKGRNVEFGDLRTSSQGPSAISGLPVDDADSDKQDEETDTDDCQKSLSSEEGFCKPALEGRLQPPRDGMEREGVKSRTSNSRENPYKTLPDKPISSASKQSSVTLSEESSSKSSREQNEATLSVAKQDAVPKKDTQVLSAAQPQDLPSQKRDNATKTKENARTLSEDEFKRLSLKYSQTALLERQALRSLSKVSSRASSEELASQRSSFNSDQSTSEDSERKSSGETPRRWSPRRSNRANRMATEEVGQRPFERNEAHQTVSRTDQLPEQDAGCRPSLQDHHRKWPDTSESRNTSEDVSWQSVDADVQLSSLTSVSEDAHLCVDSSVVQAEQDDGTIPIASSRESLNGKLHRYDSSTSEDSSSMLSDSKHMPSFMSDSLMKQDKPPLSEAEFQRLHAKFSRSISSGSETKPSMKRSQRSYFRNGDRVSSGDLKASAYEEGPTTTPLGTNSDTTTAENSGDGSMSEELSEKKHSPARTSSDTTPGGSPVDNSRSPASPATSSPTSTPSSPLKSPTKSTPKFDAAKFLESLVYGTSTVKMDGPVNDQSDGRHPPARTQMPAARSMSSDASIVNSSQSTALKSSRNSANHSGSMDGAATMPAWFRRQRVSSGDLGGLASPPGSPRRSMGESFNPFPTVRRPSLTSYASEVGIKLGLYSSHDKAPMASASNGSKSSSVKR